MTAAQPLGAVDARWVGEELSGIGRYTVELLREFGSLESPYRFLVMTVDEAGKERVADWAGIAGKGRFSWAAVGKGPFHPAGQWEAARLLRREKAAVYHSTNFMVPLPAFPRGGGGETRCVCNIHDLIPLVHPEFTPKALKTRFGGVYRVLMGEIARRVDAVVTGSESAKADIVARLNIGKEKVAVAVDGVGEGYAPLEGRSGPSAGRKTVLYVGRQDPYKNLKGLVEAFALLAGRGLDARLRIAGPPDARYPEARTRAAELGLGDRVEWAGYLGEEELRAAYREADALGFLSRYEGFGLPVAEAMASGLPVVCSNAASLPEVAGDAALLVDPEDTKGAADALERVLTDAGLWRRMRAAGLEQSKRFRWKTAATAVLQLYGAMLCEPA